MRKINKRGGIGRVVYELARNHSKENEVHLLTSEYENPTEGVVVHNYHLPNRPFWLQIWFNLQRTASFLRSHGHEFDLIVSHDAESYTCDILHKHSVYKKVLNKYMGERGLIYSIYKILDPRTRIVLKAEERVVNNAKHIIAISHKVKEELMEWYDIPEEKISVVYNGVNINEFNPEFKEYFRYKVRKKHRMFMKDRVILFAGYEWERKGLESLIKALGKIPHKKTKILVVGSGDEEKYKQIARDSGVVKRVVFAGPVKNIQRYYAAADLFVFPVDYEPFGLVITEAMSSGLPVFTTKHAGAAELIEHGCNGFILKDTKPATIAKQVKPVLENNQLMRLIGVNARITAEKYSWKKQAYRCEEIYLANLDPELALGFRSFGVQ